MAANHSILLQRSISPSKFESHATGSPTKLTVPNRKLRNQPSNRVHDIEFAAEISTSLIAQVRNLQALLADRDEEVKTLQFDKSTVEREAEAFQQRLKTLDESENRYKDENWNLQTRLQELVMQQKDASDREKKLTHSLNVSNTEKSTVQKELDEVKATHSKLIEEHAVTIKHHDIELGTAKRSMAMAEGERAAMQRKMDELTSQNQELAKAFSAQRGRALERGSASGLSDDDLETAAANITPEHSPPPSPVKGTPRHSMLETETVKTSLQHAQRTIQSQRSQIHREKTEKLELRRIVQDLRDDLERARSDTTGAAQSNRRGRKSEAKEVKKPQQRLLGNFRSSRQEIATEDAEWEDHQDMPPPRTTSTPIGFTPQGGVSLNPADSSDQFETANEASESAFETANERGTETEDFQTGNEDFTDSDGVATETEGTSRGFGRMTRPPSLPAGLARHTARASFDSTASTSADEDDFFPEVRTPTTTLSFRSRIRNSRRPVSRGSRQASEEPNLQGSPASFASGGLTTPQTGQSLFAELQDFRGSDDESIAGISNTPGRRSVRSMTPGSIRRAMSPPPAVPELPKVIMVDTGVMTDPIHILSDTFSMTDSQELRPPSLLSVTNMTRPASMESVIQRPDYRGSTTWRSSRGIDDVDLTRPMSTFSYSDAGAQVEDMDEKLAQFPVPPTSAPRTISSVPSSLNLSFIVAEHVEPQEEFQEPPPTPPTLKLTAILTEDVEPIMEPETPPPALRLSVILAEDLEPRAEPEIPPPLLSFSSITAEDLEPRAEPEIPLPTLTMSNITTQDSAPIEEPVVAPPPLSFSNIAAEGLEPRAEPEIPPPTLSFSSIATEGLEPRAEPEIPLPSLSLSHIFAEGLEPRAEPDTPLPALSLSSITTEDVEPRADPEKPLPELSVSAIMTEILDPISVPASPELASLRSLPPVAAVIPALPEPELSISSIMAQELKPVMEREVVVLPPSLNLSSILAEHLEPREEPVVVPVQPSLVYSDIAKEHVEPIIEPPPALMFSSILTENTHPIKPASPILPPLGFSSILTEATQPIAPTPPTPLALKYSSIFTEDTQPIVPPSPALPSLKFSSILTENTQPITPSSPSPPSLVMSSLSIEDVEPVSPPSPPELVLSSITTEDVEPISPLVLSPSRPFFGFSSISSIEMRPVSPRTPKRDGFILPRDMQSPFSETSTPDIHQNSRLASLMNGDKDNEIPIIIAEDETRQSPMASTSEDDNADLHQPLREISVNAAARPRPDQRAQTNDQGAQTSLTAGAIDQLLKTSSSAQSGLVNVSTPRAVRSPSFSSAVGSPASTGTVRIHRGEEYFDTPVSMLGKGKMVDDTTIEMGQPQLRPGSAASGRSSIQDAPPLPSNHRQMIQAARSGSSNGLPSQQGNMGPPMWPASSSKNQRPRTPNHQYVQGMSSTSVSGRGTPTPRAVRAGSSHGNAELQVPNKHGAISRQSSVSSFASELDSRFNMRPGELDPTGFGSNTDPRMIQAITQTMIGEYLWKYTRKTGRDEMSEKRHRRYFWVHPYTRTLYWSDRDPSTAGRTELKAKSVPIEAVRVVTDDNPMPPGLHRKSLVIISPGRTIKFTCTTGQRHETWFNALSYLLLRTSPDGQSDAEEIAENITREDVEEFNPQFGRRPANGTRPVGPASLSSYNSRTTRNESPAEGYNMDIPTLTPAGYKLATTGSRPAAGTITSKLSGYWRSGGPKLTGTLSSLRGRNPSGHTSGIYEASEVHDSAEDVREIIERQDRESDRLENVRACCDGKSLDDVTNALVKRKYTNKMDRQARCWDNSPHCRAKKPHTATHALAPHAFYHANVVDALSCVNLTQPLTVLQH